jgi:hypothetical protein
MTNPIEEKINRAARSVEPSAEFSQKLWNEIKMKPLTVKDPKRISRRFWIPAAAVLGVLLVLVIVGPQNVLAAFQGLLSYIPGVGFVQNDETTLYLAEPVVVEQDGYTFTLDQVVANKDKVAIAYHMVSPTANFDWCAYNGNFLVLPDGKSNRPIGGGGGANAEGVIEAQIDYFPLPEGVKKASISVSADPSESGCAAPMEWTIAFNLGTEKPDVEFLQVVENVTPQTNTSIPPTDSSEISSSETPIQFSVDKYVELADGYLLTGHVDFADKTWSNVSIDYSTITAQDANGNEVILEPANENLQNNEFALKVVGKGFTAPITIHEKNLYVNAYYENGPSFSFDAGSDPQFDQNWSINKELEVINKTITVKNIKVINQLDPDGQITGVKGYSILLESPERMDPVFMCIGQTGDRSFGSEGRILGGNEYLSQNFYEDGIPTGKVTCSLSDVFFKLPGDWMLAWQPILASE